MKKDGEGEGDDLYLYFEKPEVSGMINEKG
jgi:hypothetical protein